MASGRVPKTNITFFVIMLFAFDFPFFLTYACLFYCNVVSRVGPAPVAELVTTDSTREAS